MLGTFKMISITQIKITATSILIINKFMTDCIVFYSMQVILKILNYTKSSYFTMRYEQWKCDKGNIFACGPYEFVWISNSYTKKITLIHKAIREVLDKSS